MTENRHETELTGNDVRDGVTIHPKGSKPAGRQHRLASWGMPVLAGAAMLAVMAAISIATVRLSTPEVVIFDMKGTMDAFLQQSAQLPLDEQQAKVRVARFNAALTRSLSDWQTRHHAIILVAPAVVSEQRDITLEIQNTVAGAMREGK
jgi:conjugal transfer pilin signal peptidase TrbI